MFKECNSMTPPSHRDVNNVMFTVFDSGLCYRTWSEFMYFGAVLKRDVTYLFSSCSLFFSQHIFLHGTGSGYNVAR